LKKIRRLRQASYKKYGSLKIPKSVNWFVQNVKLLEWL